MAVTSEMQERGSPLTGIRREHVAVGALGLTLSIAFLVVALSVSGDGVLQADIDVGQWIQRIDFFAWQAGLDVSEVLTGAPLGVIIWAMLAGGFWAAGRPVEALIMGAAPLIWLTKLGIQELVPRHGRPSSISRSQRLTPASGFPAAT